MINWDRGGQWNLTWKIISWESPKRSKNILTQKQHFFLNWRFLIQGTCLWLGLGGKSLHWLNILIIGSWFRACVFISVVLFKLNSTPDTPTWAQGSHFQASSEMELYMLVTDNFKSTNATQQEKSCWRKAKSLKSRCFHWYHLHIGRLESKRRKKTNRKSLWNKQLILRLYPTIRPVVTQGKMRLMVDNRKRHWGRKKRR